ncbi:MAG: hypothetical protein SGI77_03405 [Pirellulaceae bacterium]|nr:hypothetical protein [Pirellulaceae bacterium]
MKKVLYIARCWKMVEWLIPTLESVMKYHQPADVDIIILDSLSTRTDVIKDYCFRLMQDKHVLGFVESDQNYNYYIWGAIRYLTNSIEQYEYVNMGSADLGIVNGFDNWLFQLTDILAKYGDVGAVSIEFERMPPYDKGFQFIEDAVTSGATSFGNFVHMPTDEWFYTVRSAELLDYLYRGGTGPGMFGYCADMSNRNKYTGRTNIQFKHYGWLRYTDDYRLQYQEADQNFLDQKVWQPDGSYEPIGAGAPQAGFPCGVYYVPQENLKFHGLEKYFPAAS